MGREKQAKMSFMRKLARDKTANTLVISAAALVPIMAMVGGGVDASRYYMAAARMQAACDAGALAARRAMTNDTFTSAHRTIGLNFFDQNFNDGIFGTENRTRDYTTDGDGVVIGNASATLPATIMDAFGYGEFNIEVSCTAEINISNSDIMFVLDVTGSMSECPNGTQCNSNSSSKIVALRTAVMNFYDTVEAATSSSAQVRYGFVPYSQQVNVGFSIPRAYMADTHNYETRVARYNPAPFPNSAHPDVDQVGETILISDQDEWLPRNTSRFNSTNTDDYRFRTDGSNGTTATNFCRNTLPGTRNVTVSGQTQSWQVFATPQIVLNQWDGGNSNNRAGCRGRVRKTRLATAADVIPQFREWIYCEVTPGTANPCNVNNPPRSPAGWESVNLSSIYANNTLQIPVGTNGAMTTQTWTGCIEEPVWMDTTGNYSPIVPAAHDLNINLVPANESQKWKPALNTAAYERRDGSGNRTTNPVSDSDRIAAGLSTTQDRPGWVCPAAARKLAEINRTDLQTYVNGLAANGNTYHDIGMVWGARFISPRGMFASENTTAPNGDAIARHIVFMTDGILVTGIENYSTQGIEWWDRRVTGNADANREATRRAARLQAICRAAQQENITVWVVAFGTALTQNLIDCASPGRAFQASDSVTLNARFQEIAQKIAALRLTS
ncbi:pilus assembly protein TadG-related protein [Porphyrobacter sp. SLTP]|uniref:pilus assembly protein TadG-related protein n=1 Tax=Porphyrobacter sp. SLTP TaxID=2683266 RepID=UPI0014129825|nr:pilus assembly protein TadG-related protein [Porphyrobacter sp. SLTP]